ncbi:MAG: hypothetical protein FMNOHCHN_03785 [Ignavibacteriaceae bacterium]|nr:hypothetical protein [Ignavibacteriaceae bacterium]
MHNPNSKILHEIISAGHLGVLKQCTFDITIENALRLSVIRMFTESSNTKDCLTYIIKDITNKLDNM